MSPFPHALQYPRSLTCPPFCAPLPLLPTLPFGKTSMVCGCCPDAIFMFICAKFVSANAIFPFLKVPKQV
eukprot:5744157-Amphidinium_carterae.1